MAEIKQVSTGVDYTLYSQFLVGRSHTCALQLHNRKVSAQHTSFRWNGLGWELCDLGSSNGTYVDGRRLQAGEHVAIVAGSQIAFGDKALVFEMMSDGPPDPVARTDSGDTIIGEDEVLALPSSEHPAVLVRSNFSGDWVIDPIDGDARRVSDGETLHLHGCAYRLILPIRWERTWKPDEDPMTVAQTALRFVASRNRDHVEITLICQDQVIPVPPRAHGYLLIELAEARVHDAQNPALPDSEHGWLHVPELLEEHGFTEHQLNLYIYRARKQFERYGVLDGQELIQRRRATRQLRIGVAQLEIAAG